MSTAAFVLAFVLQYKGCPAGGGGSGPPPPPQPPPAKPAPTLTPPPGGTVPTGPGTSGTPANAPRSGGPAAPGRVETPGPALGPRVGPSTGGPLGPRPTGLSTGGARGGGLELGPDLDWQDWWWLNAYDYLRPLGPRQVSTLGADGDASSRHLEAIRAALVESVRRLSRDEDSRVRVSAALTAGRIYEPSLRAALASLLDDPSPMVRQAAIGGLGLSGAGDQAQTLLRIALSDDRSSRSGDERDMAFLALGLSAHRGMEGRYAGLLVGFLGRGSATDRLLFGPSAATSLAFTKDAAALDALDRLAGDAAQPAALRARALWSLGNAGSAAHLPATIAALRDRDADVRRASALALGTLGAKDPAAAVRPLRALLDSEGDPAVRAFALLSLGRIGGGEARAELLDRLVRGKQALRPWAAIGAGLLARAKPDPEIGSVLARALAAEKNRETRAAVCLAVGLSRTTDARESVRRLVLEGENGRERVFGAIATALAGDEEGRESLRRAIRDIPNPGVRATAGLALAVFGHPDDASTLVELFRDSDDPGALATSALALAWHGSEAALDALQREVANGSSGERRGIALLSLGLGVAPGRVPASVAATSGWNYLASLEAAHMAARLWM